MAGIDLRSPKWWIGLVMAILAAVGGYLAGGCSRLELGRIQSAAAVRASLCEYVRQSESPELASARSACEKGDELEAVLRAAAQCE